MSYSSRVVKFKLGNKEIEDFFSKLYLNMGQSKPACSLNKGLYGIVMLVTK